MLLVLFSFPCESGIVTRVTLTVTVSSLVSLIVLKVRVVGFGDSPCCSRMTELELLDHWALSSGDIAEAVVLKGSMSRHNCRTCVLV